MSKIYINHEKIEEIVKRLADRIIADYEGEQVTLVCVLKGAYRFFSDLSYNFPPNTRIDFVQLASYEGENSTGKVELRLDVKQPVTGENVIIVEDIVDTGRSMKFLLNHLREQKPKSLKICTFLDKPVRRVVDNIKPDYVAFEIPDYFVIGYGLDYNEKYRTLKDLEIYRIDEKEKIKEPKSRI